MTDPSGPRVVVAHEAELSGKKSSPSGGKVVRQHQKGCISIGRQPGCEGFHCHRQCFPRNQPALRAEPIVRCEAHER